MHVKIAALTERWKEVQIKEAELRATLRARDLEVHKLELSVQTERIQVNEQDQELLAMAKKCEQHQQMQQSLINEHQVTLLFLSLRSTIAAVRIRLNYFV